jgi:superfamily II DNA or RNA helicase
MLIRHLQAFDAGNPSFNSLGALHHLFYLSLLPLQARVKALAKAGQLDVVIHVGQLGEGFDAPALSIVAVFKVMRSMAPFMQLLGRAVRRIPVSGLPTAAVTAACNSLTVSMCSCMHMCRCWRQPCIRDASAIFSW